jgi:hypothetical protein
MRPSQDFQPVLVVVTALAAAVPSVLAYNLPPSAALLNQAAALMGWGAVTAFIGIRGADMQYAAGDVAGRLESSSGHFVARTNVSLYVLTRG